MWTIFIVLTSISSLLDARSLHDSESCGSLWPYPTEWISANDVLTIDPTNFHLYSNLDNCSIIDENMKLYKDYILYDKSHGKRGDGVPVLQGINITIEDKYCGYPDENQNEMYTLIVKPTGIANIQAVSVWGALRGLETLSQLVYQNKQNFYMINVTYIKDSPKYSYRGILIDTTQHFLSKNVIKKVLDAMAFNKFNVLHWKIMGERSFPFESKIYPNITEYTAFSPRYVYTQEDIKELIDYAALHGIRVIPEFDILSSLSVFAKVFPDATLPCYIRKFKTANKYVKPKAAASYSNIKIFNVMENSSYDILLSFIEEFRKVFKDNYIHIGMNGNYYKCWKRNDYIKIFMKKHQLKFLPALEQYHLRKILREAKQLGFKFIVWQHPIDNGVQVHRDIIVQISKNEENVKNWKKNHKIIISSCWNLNRINYNGDWKEFYQCDPEEFNEIKVKNVTIIGGEATLMGQYIDNTNILSRMWPRASAVAERLWSNIGARHVNSALFRLNEHRCRMIRRGIPAEPIRYGYCGNFEWNSDESVKLKNEVLSSTNSGNLTNCSNILNVTDASINVTDSSSTGTVSINSFT